MAEEYIGSQQHFEDCINEYYDQKERYEKEMYAQMEKDYYKDMENNTTRTWRNSTTNN